MGDVRGGSSTSSHSLSENDNSSKNEGDVAVRGAHPYDPSSNPAIQLPVYDMSKNRLMYIINHENYQQRNNFKPPQRTGTEKDKNILSETFKELKFKVDDECDDLTHDKIMDKLKEICNMDHTNTSCLAIAILTHGEADGILYAADKKYPLTDVINYIIAEKRLAGKPKLFFIQACRGEKVDQGHRVQIDGEHGVYTIPTYADSLVLMSTIDNHVSFRNWMMPTLCEVLKETRNHDLHILDVITLMNNRVADRISCSTTNPIYHEKKQIAETNFTLTKILKF